MFYIIFNSKKTRYTIESIRRGYSNLAKDYPIFLPKNKNQNNASSLLAPSFLPYSFPSFTHTKQHHNQFVCVLPLEMCHGK